MNYLLAILPILTIIFSMVVFRWGGQIAGPVGWAAGLLISALAFGLTPEVFWVSQAKGVLLSVYVLMVLWPALLLYNNINRVGGIQALASGLECLICDDELLLITIAWAFSGLLEGLAGFGLPVAVVSPMLVSLGVSPVLAVAAVAIGHSWSVTFGDMGVIFQTLIGVSQMDSAILVAPAAVTLGIACIFCGLAVWRLLRGQSCLGRAASASRWTPWKIITISLVMAGVQYILAVVGLSPLAGFGAGVAGVGAAILISRKGPSQNGSHVFRSIPFRAALAAYGGLAILMAVLALPGPIHTVLNALAWIPGFPSVSTLSTFDYPSGYTTQAGNGQIFRWLLHPGVSIFLIAVLSYGIFRIKQLSGQGDWKAITATTWKSAAPVSIGILFTVCLSTLMDHSGMTMLLANGLSALLQKAFPVVSPLVGILGAFATGSNNNSNVLFASLQKNVALLLKLSPAWLIAAQTAGGSLGSMIAPAKIIVGCSTVGLSGKDGSVLKKTLPYGIGIGFLVGICVWLVISLTP